MPIIQVKHITIRDQIEGPENALNTVLTNGLAYDLTTWSSNTPSLLAAGCRVLTYDNRGIGQSSRPSRLCTAGLLADDLRGLLESLSINVAHFIGVSIGDFVVGVGVYVCAADSVLLEVWGEMARRMSVQGVMRDVTLWAFTVTCFRKGEAELKEVDQAMQELDMLLEASLAQLNVIQMFDSASALEGL
ncbi:hypothetical protein DOTSEDRAFT_34361 [Dothistroma septosporum NZE10]|uniref:AB hydrolase-1 domain-containing protein n=1 Tax=Dothistroma septosporum (strain NZE10 / CBS 128990) TaxID=675120 RepID=N1PJU6_DOTSN|nr:hypothetical protein DOTSEDRAFT_34361 [Dothistroma septosporum NZE10]